MVLKVGEARAWVRERERKRLVQEGKKRPEEEKSILSVKAFLGKTALKPEALKRYQKGLWRAIGQSNKATSALATETNIVKLDL